MEEEERKVKEERRTKRRTGDGRTWLVESCPCWERSSWTRMWRPEVKSPARMAQVSGSGSMLYVANSVNRTYPTPSPSSP